MSRSRIKQLNVISALCLAACICIGVWGIHSGILTSQQEMERIIQGAGALGPILFMIFQAVQVVLPILPGGVSCLVGVILFGPVMGFIYNYVGICIGSFIAFGIAKNCGRPLIINLFGLKQVMKYDKWTEEKGRFDKMFALAIFLPVAPDDMLCYLAGTTTMSWKRFIVIILLGKPFAIFLYSILLNTAWTGLLGFLK